MPHRAHLLATHPPPLKPIIAGLLLVGLLGGCAGQGGDDPDVEPAAPSGGEWRTDGCATPRSPVVVHTAGVDMPIVDDQIQELANKITKAGAARFSGVYAGLELTPDQVGLIVYRKPSAELDAYLRAEAADQCVIVRDARHSQVELQALADRITDDMPYWRSRGLPSTRLAVPRMAQASRWARRMSPPPWSSCPSGTARPFPSRWWRKAWSNCGVAAR
jgi:hypothetical protein